MILLSGFKTGMSKRLIFFAVFALFLVVGAFVFVKKVLLKPTALSTTVEDVSGTVSSATGPLASGQTIADGQMVKTAKSSSATVVFPDDSLIRLDENTEIVVNQPASSQISIVQSAGRTWSRVVKLMDRSYEVETPTGVATVRGTAFSITVGADKSSDVDTDTGIVEMASMKKVDGERQILGKISVEGGYSTHVVKDQRQLVRSEIRQELKNSAWFKKNRELDLKPSREKSEIGILDIFKTISPQDIMKLKRLAQKAQSGGIKLTDQEQKRLEPLAKKLEASNGNISPALAPEIADALAIVSPEDFSDREHWAKVIRIGLPILMKMKFVQIPELD